MRSLFDQRPEFDREWPEELIVVEVDPAAPEAAALIAALDADLNERYPGHPVHGIDLQEFRRSGGVFLIGKLHTVPVACGAIRPLSETVAELKRVFVRKEKRGHGFGRTIVLTLEKIAAGRGYNTMRLETGANQPEAIHLYERMGYRPIPCFGEYITDATSRCFEKSLFA
jgi:putative acetyltransferase